MSGSRIHSKKAWLSIKTRRLFCDGPPYGSMYFAQGDVVGEFARVLVEGGGWWKCRGLFSPPRPAGLATCCPRVEYGTSTTCDSPRGCSHLTDRRRVFTISIHFLIAGTRIIPTIRTHIVHPPSTPTTITEADGAPIERSIRSRGSVDWCGRRR